MSQKVERRNIAQEFRVSQEGEAPKISGYAAVFDSPSELIYGMWTETIDPHAFDSVLAGQHDCRALFNHDENQVLGRESASTLSLTVDSRGLAYEIDPPDTTLAKDLMVSMRRKDIKESSFSFVCKRDQWTDNPDGTVTRRILEFSELLDVSPVTYPAFAATSASARNLPDSMPREMRSRFEKRDDFDPDCVCGCPQCSTGACGICSSDPQCIGAQRSAVSESDRQKMQMQLALLSMN